MNFFNNFLLTSLFLTLTLATPTPIYPRNRPTPTRPFTLAAFQSPWAPNSTNGNGVSGKRVSARDGSFWLNPQDQGAATSCGGEGKCPPGKETVLWVDEHGQAWLDSKDPQPVYLNTETGVLSFQTPKSTPPNSLAPGGILVNFLHLGKGTAVYVPSPEPGYYNAGPGSFSWEGSTNSYWFLCPRPGSGYQVMKLVGGTENWNLCVVVQLVALDYTGPSPAAGVYL